MHPYLTPCSHTTHAPVLILYIHTQSQPETMSLPSNTSADDAGTSRSSPSKRTSRRSSIFDVFRRQKSKDQDQDEAHDLGLDPDLDTAQHQPEAEPQPLPPHSQPPVAHPLPGDIIHSNPLTSNPVHPAQYDQVFNNPLTSNASASTHPAAAHRIHDATEAQDHALRHVPTAALRHVQGQEGGDTDSGYGAGEGVGLEDGAVEGKSEKALAKAGFETGAEAGTGGLKIAVFTTTLVTEEFLTKSAPVAAGAAAAAEYGGYGNHGDYSSESDDPETKIRTRKAEEAARIMIASCRTGAKLQKRKLRKLQLQQQQKRRSSVEYGEPRIRAKPTFQEIMRNSDPFPMFYRNTWGGLLPKDLEINPQGEKWAEDEGHGLTTDDGKAKVGKEERPGLERKGTLRERAKRRIQSLSWPGPDSGTDTKWWSVRKGESESSQRNRRGSLALLFSKVVSDAKASVEQSLTGADKQKWSGDGKSRKAEAANDPARCTIKSWVEVGKYREADVKGLYGKAPGPNEAARESMDTVLVGGMKQEPGPLDDILEDILDPSESQRSLLLDADSWFDDMNGTSTRDKGKGKATYYFEIGEPGEAPDPDAWYGDRNNARSVDHPGNEQERLSSANKVVDYFSIQKQPTIPNVQSQLNEVGGIPAGENGQGKAVDYTFHEESSTTALPQEPTTQVASTVVLDGPTVRDIGVVQLLGAHQPPANGNPYETNLDGPDQDTRRCNTPCNSPASDYTGSRHSSSSSADFDSNDGSASRNMQPVDHPRRSPARSQEASEQESRRTRLKAFGRRVLSRSG